MRAQAGMANASLASVLMKMTFGRPGRGGGALAAAIGVAVLCACAGKPFAPQPIESVTFRERAQTQSEGGFRVSAAVPSAAESAALFGVPLYDRRVQAVWLEIRNETGDWARIAPTSLDRSYFSPLEVAYVHRSGFSGETRQAMDAFFHDAAIPRFIPAGATGSGYVFTHLDPGTKGFNVDLFGIEGGAASFTFFIDVPGFAPDHALIDFASLYDASQVEDHDSASAHAALSRLPCCSSNRAGDAQGEPATTIAVGTEEDVLHALLRAGWYETRRPIEEHERAAAQHFFGRSPDAVFRFQRPGQSDRSELRAWLAPLQITGKRVWLIQVTNYFGQSTALGRALIPERLDPDIDNARDHFLQRMWYSQGLEQLAWIETGRDRSITSEEESFTGATYFTDGHQTVLWLSGSPISMSETRIVDWDEPPLR